MSERAGGEAGEAGETGETAGRGDRLVLHVGSGYQSPGDGVLSTYVRPVDTSGATPAWSLVQELPCDAHPTHLDVSPDGGVLYVNIEAEQSAAVAYARDRWDGSLTRLGTVRSGERGAAYIGVLGRFVVQVNYSSHSVAVLALDETGDLAAVAQVVPLGEGAYPHSARMHPSGQWVYVANRTANTIARFALDASTGHLDPDGPPFPVPSPAEGPRHLVFDPTGRFLYCSDETSSTVSAYRVGDTGALRHLQTLATVPAEARAGNYPADLCVHPSGRAVYVANRGYGSIAVLAADPDAGTLTLAGDVPTGPGPRNLSLDPAGRVLVAGSLPGDTVSTYAVEPGPGRLAASGPPVKVPLPSGVLLAPLPSV